MKEDRICPSLAIAILPLMNKYNKRGGGEIQRDVFVMAFKKIDNNKAIFEISEQ